MTAATPAEYGAAWLDEHDPGWADRIALWNLDLEKACNCVLGQLYSQNGRSGYTIYYNRHGQKWTVRLGFDVPDDLDPFELATAYAELNAEWSQLVAARTTTKTDPQEVPA